MRASPAGGKEEKCSVPYPALSLSAPQRARGGEARAGLTCSAPLALVHCRFCSLDFLKGKWTKLARDMRRIRDSLEYSASRTEITAKCLVFPMSQCLDVPISTSLNRSTPYTGSSSCCQSLPAALGSAASCRTRFSRMRRLLGGLERRAMSARAISLRARESSRRDL